MDERINRECHPLSNKADTTFRFPSKTRGRVLDLIQVAPHHRIDDDFNGEEQNKGRYREMDQVSH